MYFCWIVHRDFFKKSKSSRFTSRPDKAASCINSPSILFAPFNKMASRTRVFRSHHTRGIRDYVRAIRQLSFVRTTRMHGHLCSGFVRCLASVWTHRRKSRANLTELNAVLNSSSLASERSVVIKDVSRGIEIGPCFKLVALVEFTLDGMKADDIEHSWSFGQTRVDES